MNRIIGTIGATLSAALITSCLQDPSMTYYTPSTPKYENVSSDTGSLGKMISSIIVTVNRGNSDKNRYIAYKVKKNLISKNYTLPDRQNLPAVQKEIAFCRSHLTKSCRVKLGKLTNSDAIFIVDYISFGRDYAIAAQLIDLESGNIRWTNTAEKQDTSEFQEAFQGMLNSEINKLLTKNKYSSYRVKNNPESEKIILERTVAALMSSLPNKSSSGLLPL